jgi:MinD superfamily P-loop ATPase
MRQLTVISGKGGTGKTTITSNFVKLASDHIAVDCDVDASNLHILLEPEIIERQDFIGGAIAVVSDSCINCGKCEPLCRFDAISGSETDIKIDALKCEGCGVCKYICPVDAVSLEPSRQGEMFVSKTGFCSLVHARLDPGAENSGLLITRIRNKAEDIAHENDLKAILIDGAPGIGCPVISSLNGVDAALIVTEPTLSAISDFKKVYEVARSFNIKVYVCINKCDLNSTNVRELERFCLKSGLEIIGMIPYDDEVPVFLSQKKFIIDNPLSSAGKEIINMWEKLERYLLDRDFG